MMKKNIQYLGIALFGLLFTMVSPTKNYAQAVSLFHETMGINATGNPIVNIYPGFDNYPISNIGFSGTADVRTTTVSSYPGASGGNNVFLRLGETFTITGINIENHDNLAINFGLHKSRVAEDGSSIVITATIDGVATPISVTLLTGTGTSEWYEINPMVTFPIGNILNLSFENISTTSNSFRIDDIYITGIPSSPTSILLSEFIAKRIENKTEISWTTASEHNHAYFEIERGTDGKSFEPIGRVQSKNNNEGASYEFTDFSPIKGAHFYRLKSVSIDGENEYSWIESISERKATSTEILLKLNVVKNQLPLTVKAFKNQTISYAIYGIKGNPAIQNSIQVGHHTDFSINVSSLAPGMYFLKTISGNEINYFKFIKK